MNILLFLINFGLSFSASEEPAVLKNDCNFEIQTGMSIRDNKFEYCLEKYEGRFYYGVQTKLDLIRGDKFGFLMQGNVWDKEKYNIKRENVGIGGFFTYKNVRAGLLGGMSYDNYNESSFAVICDVRYKTGFQTNSALALIEKLIGGWNYSLNMNCLFSKARTEFGIGTSATFNLSKIVGFELGTERKWFGETAWQEGKLGLKFDF